MKIDPIKKVGIYKRGETDPGMNVSERLAVKARSRLVMLLKEHGGQIIPDRLLNWSSSKLQQAGSAREVNNALIKCLERALIIPMDRLFFDKAQARSESLVNTTVGKTFQGSRSEFWCFTDFTLIPSTGQLVPDGYECAGLLVNLEPEAITFIGFYMNISEDAYQPIIVDNVLPYLYGLVVNSNELVEGDMAIYAAIEQRILERYGQEIRDVEHALNQPVGKRGWRLTGYC